MSIHSHDHEDEAHLSHQCGTCLIFSISDIGVTHKSENFGLSDDFILLELTLSYSNLEYFQNLSYSKGARAPPCIA